MMFKRGITLFVIFSFILSYYQPVSAQASPATGGEFSLNDLPVPGKMVDVSAAFAPLALKGLVVDLKKPLEFQFIVDTGRGPQDASSIKEEANHLVKYFLAGLTIPEGDLWVNLSPYEKNRMVPGVLGQTELGRDLLAQDYILKQLTASLIYPEKDLGKEFWSTVYKKAQEQFGTTNIPVNTFNKVWILPDQAEVFENGAAAYVTQATLKVMLDEDYLSLSKHQRQPGDMASAVSPSTLPSDQGQNAKAPQGNTRSINTLASQIIREIVLPEIEHEVNTGKNFAPLRQIYDALILAKWYKETIQNSLLDALYTNKNKINGVNLNDPAIKEKIYNRYLQAYKKGVFNYIKEDISDSVPTQTFPRKYFSGGISRMETFPLKRTRNAAMVTLPDGEAMAVLRVNLTDAPMRPLFAGPAASAAMTNPQQITDDIIALRENLAASDQDHIIVPYTEPTVFDSQPVQVLIKPEATASKGAILDAIEFIRKQGYGIQNITIWKGPGLKKRSIIIRHYGISAQAAVEGRQYLGKNPALKEKLLSDFNISSDVYASMPVYGGQELVEAGIAAPDEINDLWNKDIPGKKSARLGPGVYAIMVDFRGQESIIINGYMPYLINFFVKPQAVTIALRIAPLVDQKATPLLELRNELGSTDLTKTKIGTLRRRYFDMLDERELQHFFKKDPKMINGYHLSASYLEALYESVLWGADLRAQPLAQRLMSLGMSWPGVEYLIREQPKDILDATENLASEEQAAQTIIEKFSARIEASAAMNTTLDAPAAVDTSAEYIDESALYKIMPKINELLQKVKINKGSRPWNAEAWSPENSSKKTPFDTSIRNHDFTIKFYKKDIPRKEFLKAIETALVQIFGNGSFKIDKIWVEEIVPSISGKSAAEGGMDLVRKTALLDKIRAQLQAGNAVNGYIILYKGFYALEGTADRRIFEALVKSDSYLKNVIRKVKGIEGISENDLVIPSNEGKIDVLDAWLEVENSLAMVATELPVDSGYVFLDSHEKIVSENGEKFSNLEKNIANALSEPVEKEEFMGRDIQGLNTWLNDQIITHNKNKFFQRIIQEKIKRSTPLRPVSFLQILVTLLNDDKEFAHDILDETKDVFPGDSRWLNHNFRIFIQRLWLEHIKQGEEFKSVPLSPKIIKALQIAVITAGVIVAGIQEVTSALHKYREKKAKGNSAWVLTNLFPSQHIQTKGLVATVQHDFLKLLENGPSQKRDYQILSYLIGRSISDPQYAAINTFLFSKLTPEDINAMLASPYWEEYQEGILASGPSIEELIEKSLGQGSEARLFTDILGKISPAEKDYLSKLYKLTRDKNTDINQIVSLGQNLPLESHLAQHLALKYLAQFVADKTLGADRTLYESFAFEAFAKFNMTGAGRRQLDMWHLWINWNNGNILKITDQLKSRLQEHTKPAQPNPDEAMNVVAETKVTYDGGTRAEGSVGAGLITDMIQILDEKTKEGKVGAVTIDITPKRFFERTSNLHQWDQMEEIAVLLNKAGVFTTTERSPSLSISIDIENEEDVEKARRELKKIKEMVFPASIANFDHQEHVWTMKEEERLSKKKIRRKTDISEGLRLLLEPGAFSELVMKTIKTSRSHDGIDSRLPSFQQKVYALMRSSKGSTRYYANELELFVELGILDKRGTNPIWYSLSQKAGTLALLQKEQLLELPFLQMSFPVKGFHPRQIRQIKAAIIEIAPTLYTAKMDEKDINQVIEAAISSWIEPAIKEKAREVFFTAQGPEFDNARLLFNSLKNKLQDRRRTWIKEYLQRRSLTLDENATVEENFVNRESDSLIWPSFVDCWENGSGDDFDAKYSVSAQGISKTGDFLDHLHENFIARPKLIKENFISPSGMKGKELKNGGHARTGNVKNVKAILNAIDAQEKDAGNTPLLEAVYHMAEKPGYQPDTEVMAKLESITIFKSLFDEVPLSQTSGGQWIYGISQDRRDIILSAIQGAHLARTIVPAFADGSDEAMNTPVMDSKLAVVIHDMQISQADVHLMTTPDRTIFARMDIETSADPLWHVAPITMPSNVVGLTQSIGLRIRQSLSFWPLGSFEISMGPRSIVTLRVDRDGFMNMNGIRFRSLFNQDFHVAISKKGIVTVSYNGVAKDLFSPEMIPLLEIKPIAMTRKEIIDHLGGKKILIVDEDDAVRNSMSRTARWLYNIELVPAQNSQEALGLLAQGGIEGVIADVPSVGIMERRDMIINIRKNYPKLPLVPWDGGLDGSRFLNPLNMALLPKPVSLDMLFGELARQLVLFNPNDLSSAMTALIITDKNRQEVLGTQLWDKDNFIKEIPGGSWKLSLRGYRRGFTVFLKGPLQANDIEVEFQRVSTIFAASTAFEHLADTGILESISDFVQAGADHEKMTDFFVKAVSLWRNLKLRQHLHSSELPFTRTFWAKELLRGHIAVACRDIENLYGKLDEAQKEKFEDDRANAQAMKENAATEYNPLKLRQILLTTGAIKRRLQKASNAMIVPGGIDLDQLNVHRAGKTIHVQFDPAQLNEFLQGQGGFHGFVPVITGFRYIKSPFPLLGVSVVKESEVLAKV